ncbi:sugar-transfer associated ATP-grasp domain-containing protein [Natrinema gelatinilyticum]|uniref:sugar-transfer associated ATP-grasp domain-containing protein n=1 Tax=Natrinema gelatinilyticum TaxID=2961571 RepID=UPI0020C28FCE|nr:sugar-transfer associated ATP-grasp domain-containing protein [Natrinema gelatinilyticum]
MDLVRACQTIGQVNKLLQAERRTGSSFELSLGERQWLYQHGFLRKSGVIYSLELNDPGEYLTDYQRFVRTKWINGRHWNALLDNKLAFHRLLGEFPDHRPTVYGLLTDGRFHAVAPTEGRPQLADGGLELKQSSASTTSRPTTEPIDWITDTLSDGDRIVVKRVRGSGGDNVHFVARADDEYVFDGTRMSELALAKTLSDFEEYLICEYVDQADYAAELFPETTNTIRIVTMFDDREGAAFIPMAIHRIGTTDSAPVDNFSKEGLSARIDRTSGTLSEAAKYPTAGSLDWHRTHPSSGVRIQGTAVPGWAQIRDRVLEIAETFSHIPYVGWDLVVTAEGEFQILEANSHPDVTSLQVHRPLLSNDRTRQFYRDHDVI